MANLKGSTANGIIFLAALGALGILIILYKLLAFIWLYVRPCRLSRYHHGERGSTWALVTGASDGIGFGFVNTLLDRGFNVLMHGRNYDKLESVSKVLGAVHRDLEVRIVVADASDPNADIAAVVNAVNNLPGKLTVLVNNVGGMPFEPPFGTLDIYDSTTLDAIINLNARFPTQLTAALLPTLRTTTPALVLNVGSALGKLGMPLLAAYSAAKSYNLRFSQTLRAECSAIGLDIEVLGVLILNVLSSRNTEGGLCTCTAADCARYSLDRVGCGLDMVWSWWRQAVQFGMLDALPYSLQEKVIVESFEKRADTGPHITAAKARVRCKDF